MAEDEEQVGEYRWESGYEKTWEAIHEDDDGLLQSSIDDIIHRAKRKRLLEKRDKVRLGMMRHLYIVIDLSESMLDRDLKPNRQICTLKLMEGFIEEFFDQNPISQLGIIVTRNKRAEKISELGGNPKRHITAVQKAIDIPCLEEPSLQNALELASQTLKHLPGHVSREIVIICGSLTTCDPGDIYTTIDFLKQNNIRCSIIGLAAELRICKVLSSETKGTYGVILDESHYRDLLFEHLNPPPATVNTESSLIRMGFPQHMSDGDKDGRPSLCLCHLDGKNFTEGFGTGGYFCPQCRSKYCELPVECKSCGLTLVSAPHLARSYHHLFPLENFLEVLNSEIPATERYCFSCQKDMRDSKFYQCQTCQQIFCIDCDLFIHETLHTCPGCANSPNILQQGIPS